MQISRGIIRGAQKVVIYGPEGIGKSYFASKFPNPVFIDTEGSTKHMDVARTNKPSSWTMLLEQVKYFKTHPFDFDTLIIDTIDLAERLCATDICATGKKDSIKNFGYQGGYIKLAEEIGRLLNQLSDLIDLGINVGIVAHAQMRKFEQPDETGSYDRWELKLEKRVSPLIKEWADLVLFANYKTYVIDADGQGTSKGTNKVQGGKRVMFTTHHPCWDAKNRHDLPPELPFDYEEINKWGCIPVRVGSSAPTITESKPAPAEPPKQESAPPAAPRQQPEPKPVAKAEPPAIEQDNIPKALADLMQENGVTVQEIRRAVASKGYYPLNTPIAKYDLAFISGVLVGAWPQVFGIIAEMRDSFSKEIPF